MSNCMERPAPSTTTTLLVRHLPEALPADTLKRLFVRYGASDLRTGIAGKLKNCAFVDFPDQNLASRAQSELHRLRFLGKVLSVERARPDGDHSKINRKEATPSSASQKAQPSSIPAQPIAPSLGIDYSFPPHLEYSYPPPNANILTNIMNTLIAVPGFYTQVLHLMNKMNLPAPFCAATPAPPLPPRKRDDLSSGESELESSEDEERAQRRKSRKRLRSEGSTSVKRVSSIKKKQPVIQIKLAPKPEENKVEDTKEEREEESKEEENKEERKEERKVASIEELEAGKIPPSELLGQAILKNYTQGNPSLVLYIKNLAKEVVVDDLYYVFGALFSGMEETQSNITVKLLQEGRMKGQAFVTFPSLELASTALAAAHSFVLKGKPMIIQFGRNQKLI